MACKCQYCGMVNNGAYKGECPSCPAGAMNSSKGWISNLEVYLLSHEDDIAIGIKDFDELRTVFVMFIGRSPEK